MHEAHSTRLMEEVGTMLRPAWGARRRPGRPPVEVEFVMPSQFHVPAGEAWHQGEKRLMLAVLNDAAETLSEDATAHHPRRRRTFVETLAWVAANDTTWPFSFVNICDTLGLDIPSLRRAFARRVEAARRFHRPE